MNRKWLGNRIKDARERRHLTQEKLSEIVDISPTHMSVLERGVKGMKLSTFIKICAEQSGPAGSGRGAVQGRRSGGRHL